MNLQVFGTRKCADTRKALRFFSERRVKTHFVDLKERAASRGELRRFAQKYGVDALIDRGAKLGVDALQRQLLAIVIGLGWIGRHRHMPSQLHLRRPGDTRIRRANNPDQDSPPLPAMMPMRRGDVHIPGIVNDGHTG